MVITPKVQELSSVKNGKWKNNMNFDWCDYNPETMGYVENWLDEPAKEHTITVNRI